MKNITLDIDDATYIKAERKALGLAMSLPQVVTNDLRDWAAEEEAIEESRRLMTARFARPDWEFAVGTPDDRFDAQILAAAKAVPCRTLYSEDLNDGQDYEGVRVVNPFAGLQP